MGSEANTLLVVCVLKSGGVYTPDYVRILRDAVARNLTIPYRFVCLSDVDVPCDRIPLRHDWPGWWSKIELFREDVVKGPTFYLDLDTVIVSSINDIQFLDFNFAMLDVLENNRTNCCHSGLLWFKQPQTHVYEKFLQDPQGFIKFHEENEHNWYHGDQAFISDCFTQIPKIHYVLPGFVKSYKYHKLQDNPEGSIICFGGEPRPHQIKNSWVERFWQ